MLKYYYLSDNNKGLVQADLFDFEVDELLIRGNKACTSIHVGLVVQAEAIESPRVQPLQHFWIPSRRQAQSPPHDWQEHWNTLIRQIQFKTCTAKTFWQVQSNFAR